MNPVIHPDTVLAALAKASGAQFEAFFKEFMAAIKGENFLPLGLTHDGGADGFEDDRLYIGERSSTFHQASVQADARQKIRGTIKRLLAFGRVPRTLIYVTSRIVDTIDVVEEALTEELGTIIRIRDGAWISNNINKDGHTRAAFSNHLEPLLKQSIEISLRPNLKLEGGDNVQACVFLSYEVENRAGKATLLQSVTDSLIVWALEETDPDSLPARLMSNDDVRSKILETFPFAKQFLDSQLSRRLDVLSAKGGANGREIRSYRKEKKFCLPYETRQEIAEEHQKIVALIYKVKEQLKNRLLPSISSASLDDNTDKIIDVIMSSVEATFRNEGLKVGIIASGSDEAPELSSISDYVDDVIMLSNFAPETAFEIRQIAISGLRMLFYDSTDEQRTFLLTLSRTYSFLFSMKYEPRIVEYFQNMKSKFHLFVGSDILVRALSEAFLPEGDRATENMFKILKHAGSTLVLTEPTLDEVWTHIISTDTEFSAEFSAIEPIVDLGLAAQAQRILIRSYFYAKLSNASSIKGWSTYIDQFCSYGLLRKQEGKDSLREYLCRRYGLEFEDKEFLERQVDEQELAEITNRLKPFKKLEVMARNDALMVLLVYARRKANREKYSNNPYGYTTWWLTQESRIQTQLGDLVKNRGARAIIRPEFLMYYISMLPRINDVEKLYNTTFPSLYGVRLGQRVKPELLAEVLGRAKKYMSYDPARVSGELKAFADKLKSDQMKKYDMTFHN